jgi:hypothetical protein
MGKVKGRKRPGGGDKGRQGAEFKFFAVKAGPLAAKSQGSPAPSLPKAAGGLLRGQGKAFTAFSRAAGGSDDEGAIGQGFLKGAEKFGPLPYIPGVNGPGQYQLRVKTPAVPGDTEPLEPHILHGPADGAYIARLGGPGEYDVYIVQEHIQ